MAKRKRAVVVKAESANALSTVIVEQNDISEDPEQETEEDFEPELAPTESEESDGVEARASGKKGGKKKSQKKSSIKEKAKKPKGKSTMSRKYKIRTEDKDGQPIIRVPQVNSDYLPLPWKGRMGFACLNTYLRSANPPIFCSRTCRIETILKHGNGGQTYVESLGLANARDLVKLIRWNEKYGIKFLRISSEMFPFASHEKYGYTLEFAEEPLKEAGRVAMEMGHRLTTHPGQFTQLASPRKEVITASVRDLEYHSQLLRLLGMTGQSDRDAVMILHMGGVFGDKEATLDRFRKNYTTLLSDDVKARLVLENDDVSWSVHDLLPICKELNIPLVLDYHHHNIRRREDLREGTLDLMPFMGEIKETWTCKNITQKQHYSEPRDDAVTDKDMRKHSKRVRNLPPCDPTMDLMIEAKDKEQAVFELYKKYGICGQGLFNEVIPHTRTDENPPEKPVKTKKKEGKGAGEAPVKIFIADEDVAMGGEERRVYWPEGKEDWLSPVKRARAKKGVRDDEDEKMTAEHEVKVEKKTTSGQQQTKKDPPAIFNDSGQRITTTTKPKALRAKGQKTAAEVEDKDKAECPLAVVPTPMTPKGTRTATARKAIKKEAPLSSPGSGPKLSPPLLVTDDEGIPRKRVFQQLGAESTVGRRSIRVRKAVVHRIEEERGY